METHEVNVANSVKPLQSGQYRATQTGSVETLHDGAEMPKRKSGQQAERWSGKPDAGC